jgi:glycosyltransferase involved in cell wall biosynthesis
MGKTRIAVIGASYSIGRSAGHSSFLKLIRHACPRCSIEVLESSRYLSRASRETREGVTFVCIPKRKLGSQSSLLGLVLTLETFLRFLRELVINRPNLLHVVNLDSVAIALVYRALVDRRCPWVYHAMDIYAYLHGSNRLVRRILLTVERAFASSASLTVTVSEGFASILGIPTALIVYPGIVPDYIQIRKQTASMRPDPRFQKDEGETWILCSGIVHRKRGLHNIVSFARQLGGSVKVICTGPIAADYAKEFGDLIVTDMVKYVGFLETEAYHQLLALCDFVAVPYDADEYYRFAPTYKFFDALLFRKPVIATKETATGEEAERLGVGVAIDFSLQDNAREPVKRLKEAQARLLTEDYYAKFADAQISQFTERYLTVTDQATSVT